MEYHNQKEMKRSHSLMKTTEKLDPKVHAYPIVRKDRRKCYPRRQLHQSQQMEWEPVNPYNFNTADLIHEENIRRHLEFSSEEDSSGWETTIIDNESDDSCTTTEEIIKDD